jgi:hypothetical protein
MNNRPTLVALEHGATHVKTHQKTDVLEEKTMQQFYDDARADVLARTLWGEARGEGT